MLSQSPEQATRDNPIHSSASSTSAAGASPAPDASADTPAPPPPPAPEAPASDSALASGSNLSIARSQLEEHGEPAVARAQVQDPTAATEVGVGEDETLARGASSGQGHKGPDTVQTPSLHPVDVASASREAPALPARPADPASPPSAAPASPEDLARQLADFCVASQRPPAPAEPEEEEWALKSIVWPPLPPTPHAAADGEGRVQGFETDGRLRVRIICQNQNGPCSLIALCNVLILRNDLDIAPGRTSVTYSYLSNLLADYFLRMTTSVPASSPSTAGTAPPATPSTELSLSAALSILPQTRYGLNLDPRFDRIDGFTSSSSGAGAGELALFSLARIPLLHGWLADPSDAETYAALVGAEGCGSYDRAVECVVEGCEIAGGADRLVLREEECSEEQLLKEVERRSRWSEDEQKKVRRAYLIQSFLSSTATQLSYPGLSALCTTPLLLPPSGLAALFRNSHLSVLYRRPTAPSSALSASQLAQEGPELFTLVTDSAFAAEEDIVWESLEDVDGAECAFFDAALRKANVRGGDWVGSRRRRREEERERERAPEGLDDPADAALARQLQAEEDAYSRALLDREQRDAESPQPRRSSRGAERTTHHTAQAGTPLRRDGGRRDGEREDRRIRKGRTSGATEAKSGGKPDKDKCVVM
ncbi:MINDY family deubiquitinase [Rhodotorula paludigena]|uniref:MINDY family deubiquitinase n=1 Tax=Rhodotorula paludigena TaxID=86838 RepID=UPI0031730154